MKTFKIIFALSVLLGSTLARADDDAPLVPVNETPKENAVSLLLKVFAAYQAQQPLKATAITGVGTELGAGAKR